MILWLVALVLMGMLGLVGYYQGAIRAAFSLVGLIFAALLAVPLAGIMKPIVRIFGFEHPLTLAFIAPALVYVIILVLFKSGALAVHKKVDTYYKYKVSETERLLWERMNQRLGICVGLANAVVYFVLICLVAYVFGYFTVQVSTAENSSFAVKTANQVAEDLKTTKMANAVASFMPTDKNYYDGIDILGDLYANPLLQSRLSSYPPFLSLSERSEFKDLAQDTKFQERLWLKQPRPSLGEFMNHDKMKPLVHNIDLYTNILGMLDNDLTDLKTYVETGKSPKFDEEKLLGHWYYDYPASLKRARKAKLNMGPLEIKKVKATLGALTNAVLTAYLDNRIALRVPLNGGAPQALLGSWKNLTAQKYAMTLREGTKELDVPASIETGKLVIRKDNFSLVFAR